MPEVANIHQIAKKLSIVIVSRYWHTHTHCYVCKWFFKKMIEKRLVELLDWNRKEQGVAWIDIINIMKTKWLFFFSSNTAQRRVKMVSKVLFLNPKEKKMIRLMYMAVNLRSRLFMSLIFGSHIIGTRYHNDWDHAIINKRMHKTHFHPHPDKQTLIQWIEWLFRKKNKKESINQKNFWGVNLLLSHNYLTFFAGFRNGNYYRV